LEEVADKLVKPLAKNLREADGIPYLDSMCDVVAGKRNADE